MSTYRIDLTWCAPGNVRRSETRETHNLAKAGEILTEGPDGWTIVFVTVTELSRRQGD